MICNAVKWVICSAFGTEDESQLHDQSNDSLIRFNMRFLHQAADSNCVWTMVSVGCKDSVASIHAGAILKQVKPCRYTKCFANRTSAVPFFYRMRAGCHISGEKRELFSVRRRGRA